MYGAAHLCRNDPEARIRRAQYMDSSGDSPYVTTPPFFIPWLIITARRMPVLLNLLGTFETGASFISSHEFRINMICSRDQSSEKVSAYGSW